MEVFICIARIGKEIESDVKICQHCGQKYTNENIIENESYFQKRNRELSEYLKIDSQAKKTGFIFLAIFLYPLSIPFLILWYLCPLLKINSAKKVWSIVFIGIWFAISFGPIKSTLLMESGGKELSVSAVIIFSLILGFLLTCLVTLIFAGLPIAISAQSRRNKLQKEELKKAGIVLQTELKHINGLPIPENTFCKINVYENKYEFVANGLNFNLESSKITDISIKTDVEISNQAVSSIGGAIAGGFLFGTLGAIIGGRAKTKKVKTVIKYLIITYLSNDEVKYIGFEAEGLVGVGALQILNNYKMNSLAKPVQNQTIDL